MVIYFITIITIIMSECIICFNTDNKLVQKWSCYHENDSCCIECINNLTKCPICRNDKTKMKEIFKGFKNLKDFTNLYKEKYKDNKCISENHNVFILKPYGVLILCNDCESIKPYCVR